MSEKPLLEQLRNWAHACRQDKANYSAELCERAADRINELESELKQANYWRERHCNTATAEAERSAKQWQQIRELESAREQDRATLARVEAERWVPVEERSPDLGVPVTVSVGRIVQHVAWMYAGDGEWVTWDDEHSAGPGTFTHWRPMPEPPALAPQGDGERGSRLSLSDCHLCGQFREHGHDCATPTPAKR